MRHTNLFKDVSEVKCSVGSDNAGKQVIEVFGLCFWGFDEIAIPFAVWEGNSAVAKFPIEVFMIMPFLFGKLNFWKCEKKVYLFMIIYRFAI